MRTSFFAPRLPQKSLALAAPSMRAGQLQPWSGRVVLDGREVMSLPPEDGVRLGVALVPKGRGMHPGFTVRENLQMGTYTRGSASAEFDEHVDRVAAVFPVLLPRPCSRW